MIRGRDFWNLRLSFQKVDNKIPAFFPSVCYELQQEIFHTRGAEEFVSPFQDIGFKCLDVHFNHYPFEFENF